MLEKMSHYSGKSNLSKSLESINRKRTNRSAHNLKSSNASVVSSIRDKKNLQAIGKIEVTPSKVPNLNSNKSEHSVNVDKNIDDIDKLTDISKKIMNKTNKNMKKIKDLDVTNSLLDKHNAILASSHMSETKSEYSYKSDVSKKSKNKDKIK